MFLYNEIQEVMLPALEDGQLYIYVVLNSPQGNIKVGRTSNIKQRLSSLSGSNGGGNKIVRIAVSEPTYLYTLESIVHSQFKQYRIPNTEWFCGEGLEFHAIVDYVDGLFRSDEYALCNQVRRDFVAKDGVNSKKES